ncbi:energy-coupling factor ABC transporter ATP-binding protein [Methanocaldococcus sp.]|uniref:energy-coupling factor ABC transporter ATP-binding protein n=1 Tax=Methanocaldococcus sp. TaxID=2152917 RepID=UPI00262CEF72|nr:energy-coupling factor ABC transporter ATP-binding protein [Methanocaldococcus sp.]MCQ6254834.1 energy-coupling factor ABC transporter ATP-binding protein [Methanocaldococcus sp.]
MKPLYELKNVYYQYPDGTIALDNINMKIYEGEVVAIIGPNGAGKTTLLKILDALEFPKKGEVYFEGKKLEERLLNDIEFMKYFRKKVGFIFQDPDTMLFSPTVWDDVAFAPLHLYDKDTAIKVTEKVINEMNLNHIKDKHPYNISGGEKKKSSIAAVLSITPDVILMDEPTSYLDPKSRNYIINLIKDLKSKNKTIVFVSHDPNLITLADRCYILNKKIIAEGTPKEIFSNVEILEKNNLDVPEVTKLFKLLLDDKDLISKINIDNLPITVDEAYNILRDLLIKN